MNFIWRQMPQIHATLDESSEKGIDAEIKEDWIETDCRTCV